MAEIVWLFLIFFFFFFAGHIARLLWQTVFHKDGGTNFSHLPYSFNVILPLFHLRSDVYFSPLLKQGGAST